MFLSLSRNFLSSENDFCDVLCHSGSSEIDFYIVFMLTWRFFCLQKMTFVMIL